MGLWSIFKEVLSGKDTSPATGKFSEHWANLFIFLDWQQGPFIRKKDWTIVLDTPLEKIKYFHFVMGAIDQLANTFRNEAKAMEFMQEAGFSLAGNIFEDVELASQQVDAYGNSRDRNVVVSRELGHETMGVLLRTGAGVELKDTMSSKQFVLMDLLTEAHISPI